MMVNALKQLTDLPAEMISIIDNIMYLKCDKLKFKVFYRRKMKFQTNFLHLKLLMEHYTRTLKISPIKSKEGAKIAQCVGPIGLFFCITV